MPMSFSSPIFNGSSLKFVDNGWNILGSSTVIYIFSLGERVGWNQNMSFRFVEGLIEEFGREVEIVGIKTETINCSCSINCPDPVYHQKECPIKALQYSSHPQKIKIRNKKGEEHEFSGGHFFPLKD